MPPLPLSRFSASSPPRRCCPGTNLFTPRPKSSALLPRSWSSGDGKVRPDLPLFDGGPWKLCVALLGRSRTRKDDVPDGGSMGEPLSRALLPLLLRLKMLRFGICAMTGRIRCYCGIGASCAVWCAVGCRMNSVVAPGEACVSSLLSCVVHRQCSVSDTASRPQRGWGSWWPREAAAVLEARR